MFKPDLSKRRIGLDLFSLPEAEWLNPDHADVVRRTLDALLKSDAQAELTLVAPAFMRAGLERFIFDARVRAYFIPGTAILATRLYLQQTLLPVLFRARNVNEIICFGQGVPALYPAPKTLSLLPGQVHEWWKLVPAFLVASAVTVDTAAQKFLLETRVPGLKTKIEVLPPAVGEEFRPYPKDASKELLESHGVKGRYFVLLGDLASASSCMVSLEAFAKIAHRPRMKSVSCVLINACSPGTMAALKRRATELKLDHRVIVLDGVPLTELPLWLSNALFAVAASGGEENPTSLMRALAAGCPLVVPAFRLFDAKLKSAVLQCHDSDPKSLAEAMSRLIAEPELRDTLVREGLDYHARSSWELRAEAYLKVFDKQRPLANNYIAA